MVNNEAHTLYHFKFKFFKFFKFIFVDSFLYENPLEFVIRRCPVEFWAQYWPSWLLRILSKFEKEDNFFPYNWLQHSPGHMTTLYQPEAKTTKQNNNISKVLMFVLLFCFVVLASGWSRVVMWPVEYQNQL